MGSLGVVLGVAVFGLWAAAALGKPSVSGRRDLFGFFDSRHTPAAEKVLRERAAKLDSGPSDATVSLRGSLGPEGVVSLDALTGTVRFAGSTGGFLTDPSSTSPQAVVLNYVASHAAALGVDSGLGSLQLTRDYVDIGGTHHLDWTQSAGGVPVFGAGLQASVTANGRLINVTGSPVANPTAPSTSPAIDSSQALAAAVADARTASRPESSDPPAFEDGGASLVLFPAIGGLRLAWQTTVLSDVDSFTSIVDAQTGRVLYRRSLVDYASGLMFDYYPNAPNGGVQHPVDFAAKGWLPSGATTLNGPYAHAYLDLRGNDAVTDVGPNSAGDWTYALSPFNNQTGCSNTWVCTWNSDLATGGFSWQTNENEAATELFALVNNYHDHLLGPPIGFTPAAGNFEGSDAVHAEALDGANTLRVGGVLVGLPNLSHIDNANFRTPPVGRAPRMQMYLWRSPEFADPFLAANGENEADIAYHEYTHGLSNRLVVDVRGFSTLLSPQARSMGEAWSDWYAMDYLVNQGLVADTPAPGEVRIGQYVSSGQDFVRFQPLDCRVGSTAPSCPGGTNGGGTVGPGGFTYGDFGKILGFPEVHTDGEIWGETLWDLRDALGSQVTESLVTRAMELSPPDPTFLDMRNAILQADLVNFGGVDHDRIWSVFAHRGMGWYAAAVDGNDTQPVEDFHLPPPPGSPFGKLLGKVADQDTGQPVAGVRIAFGGHSSGFTTDIAGVSATAGRYDIKRIFVGTYPKVFATGAGYDRVVVPSVSIGTTATVLNWTVRRDWASIFGGGSISSFTGPDYTAFGCGPTGAIDQSEISGWGSNSIDDAGNHITPDIVIALPRTIKVTQFAIDPANTCGDDATASVKDYRIETSSDGTTWTVASGGQFANADRGRMNPVSPTAGTAGVRFVRFTMLSQQLATDCSANPNQSGCAFADMSEIEVYGRPS